MLPLLVPLFISASAVPMNWLLQWKLDAIAAVKDVRACMSWHMPAAITWPLLDYYTGGWPRSTALGERMRTIKLVVAYDGSAYHGFQKQKNVQTVQNVLEEVLTMLCGEKVVTAGSGRTDAGTCFGTDGDLYYERAHSLC